MLAYITAVADGTMRGVHRAAMPWVAVLTLALSTSARAEHIERAERAASELQMGKNYARACGANKRIQCVATQSSNNNNGENEASLAVNGDQQTGSQYCTRTDALSTSGGLSDNGEYYNVHGILDGEHWMVDLDKLVTVQHLKIYGRSDIVDADTDLTGRQMTQGYTIYVGTNPDSYNKGYNNVCYNDEKLDGLGFSPIYPNEITCDSPVSGQYVWITIKPSSSHQKSIVLCEVEVYGVELFPGFLGMQSAENLRELRDSTTYIDCPGQTVDENANEIIRKFVSHILISHADTVVDSVYQFNPSQFETGLTEVWSEFNIRQWIVGSENDNCERVCNSYSMDCVDLANDDMNDIEKKLSIFNSQKNTPFTFTPVDIESLTEILFEQNNLTCDALMKETDIVQWENLGISEWVIALPGNNCDITCESAGLLCDDAMFPQNIGDPVINELFASLGRTRDKSKGLPNIVFNGDNAENVLDSEPLLCDNGRWRPSLAGTSTSSKCNAEPPECDGDGNPASRLCPCGRRWLKGGKGKNCVDACDDVGLLCDVTFPHLPNGQMLFDKYTSPLIPEDAAGITQHKMNKRIMNWYDRNNPNEPMVGAQTHQQYLGQNHPLYGSWTGTSEAAPFFYDYLTAGDDVAPDGLPNRYYYRVVNPGSDSKCAALEPEGSRLCPCVKTQPDPSAEKPSAPYVTTKKVSVNMGTSMNHKVINTCVINDDNVLPYVGNDECIKDFNELSNRRRLCPCEVQDVGTRCFCGWINADNSLCELHDTVSCDLVSTRLTALGKTVLAGEWETICDQGTYATLGAARHGDGDNHGTYVTLKDLSTVEQAFREANMAMPDCNKDEAKTVYTRKYGCNEMCAFGKAQPTTGSSTCTQCESGKYGEIKTGETASTCIDCYPNTISPAGSFSKADCACAPGFAGFNYNCTAIRCKPGEYSPYWRKQVDNLPIFSQQDYSTVNSKIIYDYVVNTMLIDHTNDLDACIGCGEGKYSSSYGASVCTRCQAGKFSVATRATICSDCASGKYSSSIGASECTPCEAGKYQNEEGKSSCSYFYSKPCPVGTQKGGTDGFVCEPCSKGKYSINPDSENCTECVAGKFSSKENANNESTCMKCDAGKYSNSSATTCTECPGGTYGDSTTASCQSCPVNEYSVEKGAKDESTCKECEKGKISVDTDVFRGKSAMKIWADHGISEWVHGGNGETCDTACQTKDMQCIPFLENQTTVIDALFKKFTICEYNFDSEEKYAPYISHKTVCYRGTVEPTCDASKASHARLCACTHEESIPVAESYYPQFKVLQSIPPGRTSCHGCIAGKYWNENAPTHANYTEQCLECPKGKYSTDGNKTCMECDEGKYTLETGSVDIDECQACETGKYGFFPKCTYCPNGTFSNDSTTTLAGCRNCSAGVFGQGEGVSMCETCNPGTYSVAGANTACSNCVENTYSPYRGATSNSTCKPCATGKYNYSPGGTSDTDCVACLAGSYFFNDTNTCKKCENGTYSSTADVYKCLDCVAGRYSSVGASVCTVCGAGKFSRHTEIQIQSWVADGISKWVVGVSGDDCYAVCASVGLGCNNKTFPQNIEQPFSDALFAQHEPNCDTPYDSNSMKSYAPFIASIENTCNRGTGISTCDASNVHASRLCPCGPNVASPNWYDMPTVPLATRLKWSNNTWKLGEDGETCETVCGSDFECSSNSFPPSLSTADASKLFAFQGQVCDIISPANTQEESFAPAVDTRNLCIIPAKYASTCDSSSKGIKRLCPCSQKLAFPIVNTTATYNVRASNCKDCPAGKYLTSTGKYAITDCEPCIRGKYSMTTGATTITTCENCPAGKFGQRKGASTCDTCGRGTYSVTCANTACSKCDAGKYWTDANGTVNQCLSCPTGTYYAETGAMHIENCTLCAKGKYQQGLGATAETTCERCRPGTYAESAGAQECTSCQNGTHLSGTGMSSQTDCKSCENGKYSLTEGASVCTDCGVGKYTISHGQKLESSCRSCVNGSQSTDDKDGCTCKVGWSGQGNGTDCEQCSEGWYKDAVGAGGCTKCTGNNSVTDTDKSACLCKSGWTCVTLACTECPKNTRKIGVGSAPCEACPANSIAHPGSSKCVCVPGWTAASYGCIKCKVDTYGLGNASCTACPSGTVSLAGSTSVAACVCIDGYVHMSSDNDCKPCDAGWRSANGECVLCPDGSESLKGSSSCRECLEWKVDMVDAATVALERSGVGSKADTAALDTLMQYHIMQTFDNQPISANCDALYQRVLKRLIANDHARHAAVAVQGAEAQTPGVSTVAILVPVNGAKVAMDSAAARPTLNRNAAALAALGVYAATLAMLAVL